MKKFENAEIRIVSLDHSDDILTNSGDSYNPGTGELGPTDWD